MIIFKSHETLNILKQFLPSNPVIVEAGAFHGNDTHRMAALWPQGTIHAFEPVPEIYEQLIHTTQYDAHVHCHHAALSDKNGEALFYIAERTNKPGIASQAGSLHEPTASFNSSPMTFPRTTTVKTLTLTLWMQENNIAHIDLLWLDTQGHELAILTAAQSILKNISVILAEVSFVKRYENQPSYDDVITWLTQQGFTYTGRDFANMSKSTFGNVLFTR